MDKRQFKLGWSLVIAWLVVIAALMLNYQTLEQRIQQVERISESVDEFRSSLSFELPYRSSLRDQQVSLLDSIKQQRTLMSEHSSLAWLQPDLEQLFFTTDRFIEQSQAYVANELGLSELLKEIQSKRQEYQSRPEMEAYYFQLSSYLFEALFSSSDSKAYKSLDNLFVQSATLDEVDKQPLQTMLAKTSRVMGSFAQGSYIVDRLINHSVYREVKHVEARYHQALETMALIGIILSVALVVGLMGMMHFVSKAPNTKTRPQQPVVTKTSEQTIVKTLGKKDPVNASSQMTTSELTVNAEVTSVTPTPQESPSQQIDFSVMIDCLGGDRESLCMLLEVFINDHRDDTQQITRLQHDDLKEAIRRAHSLKGVGGNLGAYHLRDVAGRLETALVKEDGEQVASLLADLEACLNKAIFEAEEFIAAEKGVSSPMAQDSIVS